MADVTGPAVSTETADTTPTPSLRGDGKHFPYPVVFMAAAWLALGVAYLLFRWRQRAKSIYIIPRVFVLCSPRTVQFHYELILRVGLPSGEFNPEKHDIDITVQGQQRNEVVPMTRLNTKTLNDEPLITSLSIIVYRLVEMPTLGSIILKHSGLMRASLYVYDFTVIDLSSNKEQYYTINKYMSSLNRVYHLTDEGNPVNVHYPIDDVPLPSWNIEDIFIAASATVNTIMLSVAILPFNCLEGGLKHEITNGLLSAVGGSSMLFFMHWLLYVYIRWNQDRREYFNLAQPTCCGWGGTIRLIASAAVVIMGFAALYLGFKIDTWQDSLVWLVVTAAACCAVFLLWLVASWCDLDLATVELGLKFRGVETISVDTKQAGPVSDMQTKSSSQSDNGGSSLSAHASKMTRSFGPRSSVKSFGFDSNKMNASKRAISKLTALQQTSSTGATPDHKTNHLAAVPSGVSSTLKQEHKASPHASHQGSSSDHRSESHSGRRNRGAPGSSADHKVAPDHKPNAEPKQAVDHKQGADQKGSPDHKGSAEHRTSPHSTQQSPSQSSGSGGRRANGSTSGRKKVH